MDKSGFQISFSWLFAIIVGAFIIFLAIYGVVRFSDTGGQVSNAEISNEIGILLNPLETGFESGTVTSISTPVNTRIYNRCDTFDNFGHQRIQVSQEVRGSFTDTGLEAEFENKYIFSEGYVEGSEFLMFSKPFEFPFKFADLIFMSSSRENYCFSGAPENIIKELEDLGQQNIFTEDCPIGSVDVCFNSFGDDCNVSVKYSSGEVIKNDETMYFETDALMYAAIFSESSVYECQVQRLMMRGGELLDIYSRKLSIASNQGCSNEIETSSFSSVLNGVQASIDLSNAAAAAENIERQNSRARCKLW